MRDIKFADCKGCIHVNKGLRSRQCKTCDAGENFEENYEDTVDFFDHHYMNNDNGICDYE